MGLFAEGTRKTQGGIYPPAFISLKLSKNDRGLAGLYKARYEVTDNKPISPDVSFQVTAVDKTARKFVWEASNGSRGTLAIRSIDGRTMRLEWRTTVFAGGPALTSGIAVRWSAGSLKHPGTSRPDVRRGSGDPGLPAARLVRYKFLAQIPRNLEWV